MSASAAPNRSRYEERIMIPVITAVAGILSAVSSVSSLSASAPAGADPVAPGAAAAPGTSFSEALNTALNRLDDAITSANDKAKAFASGDPNVSLSDVMISLEQANV